MASRFEFTPNQRRTDASTDPGGSFLSRFLDSLRGGQGNSAIQALIQMASGQQQPGYKMSPQDSDFLGMLSRLMGTSGNAAEGMDYLGGSQDFDERTGKYRSTGTSSKTSFTPVNPQAQLTPKQLVTQPWLTKQGTLFNIGPNQIKQAPVPGLISVNAGQAPNGAAALPTPAGLSTNPGTQIESRELVNGEVIEHGKEQVVIPDHLGGGSYWREF